MNKITIDQVLKAMSPETLRRALAAITQDQLDSLASTPTRQRHLAGAGSQFVVLNKENRAIAATRDQQLAEFKAFDIYQSRSLLDLKGLSPSARRSLTNALAQSVSKSTIADSPAVPPPAQPKKNYPPKDKTARLLSEIAREVSLLALPPDWHTHLLDAAKKLAVVDVLAARELIFEISLLMKTAVYDKLTGEITEFESASDASIAAHKWNHAEGGMITGKNGKPIEFRFRTVRP